MTKPCTLDDLAKHASASTRRLNPQLFAGDHGPRLGAVDTAQHRKPARTLDRQASPRRRCKAGVERCSQGRAVVTLVAHVRTLLDGDNLQNACKPLRDAIAAWLGIDDGDPSLRWEYGQVETRGDEGVCVRVERIRIDT